MKTSFHTARSIRYARVALLLAAVSAVQACSSDAISTAPQFATRGPAGTTTEPTQIRVSGTVTNDDGAPVAGVIINVYSLPCRNRVASVVSDDAGFYSIRVRSGVDMIVSTEKAGYASVWLNHSIGASDLQWDLRIYRTPNPVTNR